MDTKRWALPAGIINAPTDTAGPTDTGFLIGELDYQPVIKSWTATGVPVGISGDGNRSGNVGSSCFAMATSLETSNGIEISGLNAEEQSDISLNINFATRQAAGFAIEVYVLYDAMLVLRENNVLELIQ